jgi:murein DD-endopeptidase MepM/ murein hydrolase activator NlpD
VLSNWFTALRASPRFLWLAVPAAVLVAAIAGFAVWRATPDASPSSAGGAALPITAPAAAAPSPVAPDLAAPAPAASRNTAAPALAQQPAASISDVVVARNDTLDAIFRRLLLDPADLAAMRNLHGVRASLDFLKPGDAIKLAHIGAAVQELARQVNETQTLHVVRGDAGFEVRMTDNPVDTRVRTATATIDSSLFQAAESARISDAVALKLANVFGWDIDFVLDIREGDRFTATYQQIYQDGKYQRDGEVLAAEFVNNGKVYRAVRFVNDAGIAGYYAPDGKPMRKAFLRAPVEFTRVSSVFNAHRLHPILNLIRGHMGTDYAAPIGTPVHAAGDGHVSFKGDRGGYGNAVVLAHSNNVSTLYGHMSRFARNLRVGSRVAQGDVIGYVGMTGLATGPHLHYEYLTNGVHRNPQTVQLPGADPLSADSLDKFLAASAPLLATLSASQPAGSAVPQTKTTAPPPVAAAPAAAPGAAPGSAGAAPGSAPPAASQNAGEATRTAVN